MGVQQMLLPVVEGGVSLGVRPRAIWAHMNLLSLSLMHVPVMASQAISLYSAPALGTGDPFFFSFFFHSGKMSDTAFKPRLDIAGLPECPPLSIQLNAKVLTLTSDW